MNKLILKIFVFINLAKFNLCGIQTGRRLRVYGTLRLQIAKNGKLTIGHDFQMISGSMINSIGRNIKSCIRVDDSAVIQIGDNVGMSNVSIWAKERIEIGANVKIGADTIISDSDMHALNYVYRRDKLTDSSYALKRSIRIGSDVFIGTRAIICKGVTIGDKSIIGAGSVVTKNVPSGEIWAGNPAKFLRKID